MFGWESPASGVGSSMAADRASRQRLPERSSLPPGVATGRPSVPFTVLSPAAARRTLASPTLLLCVAGVVLPNLLSLGALAAGIGMPPRTTAIAAYAALALVARSPPARSPSLFSSPSRATTLPPPSPFSSISLRARSPRRSS